ncbi:Uncharacterized conserved protein, DUF58 family, contains vWF domain [Marinitoga hydrogenitolerans DSM 16785]|uniref:Uncharacterized conserved protein, DUF58 family, contains vWF domain n=1 Tax=Marinitoga hydrogenitolerans (strain DSM 16785 / JCM 12826 / AT1271) TaxID=1122195 RepID=A0A1M4S6K4_MARH1|nr:DUF58 domain-containing protein [Marinitoga hydrogenitolerans]SHE27821.1 Uncharacterized conserved protein, DUF58 family, contains vWF domain [Marinitoga hydrogenitolerans DSM 16785]
MKYKIKGLLLMSIASILFNIFYFSNYTILLLVLVLFGWYEFFQKKKVFENLEIEYDLEYEKCFIEEEIEYRIYLKNNSNEDIYITISPSNLLSRLKPPFQRIKLLSNEKKKITFITSFGTRGIKEIGYISINYKTPLGFEFWKIKKVNKTIEVLPEFIYSEFNKESLKKLLPGQKSNIRVLEDVTYVENIDEYNNEPMNRINWKVSAKYDKLMVKKYAHTSTGKVYMFVDLNLPDGIPKNNIFWKSERKIYEEYALKAAASIIRNQKLKHEDVNLVVIGKEIKRISSNDWINYYDILSISTGTEEPEYKIEEIIEHDLPYFTYEDTVIIISIHLTDKIIPDLIKLRAKTSKVIVLIMPYGFRIEHEGKLNIKEHDMFRIEAIDLEKKTILLEENHIIVRLVSPNNSLTEIFETI